MNACPQYIGSIKAERIETEQWQVKVAQCKAKQHGRQNETDDYYTK